MTKGERHRSGRPFAAMLGLTAAIALPGGPLLSAHFKDATSPDGARPGAVSDPTALRGHGSIAFVSDGDLYVVDGSTGSLRRVTSEDADASDPQYSPNGRWLIFQTGSGSTSWIASADGSGARKLSGTASWLPNGQLLLVGSRTVVDTVASNGSLEPSDTRDAAEMVRVGRSSGYLYFDDTLKVDPPASSSGVETLETSDTPGGTRTLWFRAATSFSSESGIHGEFFEDVTVLPDGRGLIVADDPDDSDVADGMPISEIERPLGPLEPLGTALSSDARPTFGPGETFALDVGGDRYAWSAKHVEICREQTATCRGIRTPPGTITLSPAFAPDGRTLAIIEAAQEPEGTIGQSSVLAWYATHRLVLAAPDGGSLRTVADTTGAASPVWSADSTSLLFVADDDLWLIARPGASPVRVAGPLFESGSWTSFYGEVDWSDQFSWSAAGAT